MLETPEPPIDTVLRSKFFTQNWSISVPSRPGVKFVRITPPRVDEWIPIATNADNNKHQDTRDKVWDEAAILEIKTQIETRYAEAPTKQQALEAFVELDGEVLGYGGIWVMGKREGSMGLVLNEGGRGKGLGKLTVTVLAQVCWILGFQPGMGTMKANAPMRGVARGLGFEEIDAVHSIEGRGVVAELGFVIKKEGFKEVEMEVEFEK